MIFQEGKLSLEYMLLFYAVILKTLELEKHIWSQEKETRGSTAEPELLLNRRTKGNQSFGGTPMRKSDCYCLK